MTKCDCGGEDGLKDICEVLQLGHSGHCTLMEITFPYTPMDLRRS